MELVTPELVTSILAAASARCLQETATSSSVIRSAHAGDRTVVEPGNHSSPGMWTCGISLWVDGGEAGAGRETIRLQPGAWIRRRSRRFGAVGQLSSSTVCCSTARRMPTSGATNHEIHIVGIARMAVAVRGHGPAGAAITLPEWDAAAGTLRVGSTFVHLPGATCEIIPGDDPIALLTPPPSASLRVAVGHPCASPPTANAWAAAVQAWRLAVPARIQVPDARVSRAWDLCSWHLLAAMERGLPRIGVGNYPGFWMRDGVLILRVLDLIGTPRPLPASAATGWRRSTLLVASVPRATLPVRAPGRSPDTRR